MLEILWLRGRVLPCLLVLCYKYWEGDFLEIRKIIGASLKLNPFVALLGVELEGGSAEGRPLSYKLIRNTLLADHLTLATHWKRRENPTLLSWYSQAWDLHMCNG